MADTSALSPEAPVASVRVGPDGRAVSWSELGDPDGRPLVFLHGTPGSRVEGQFLDAGARAHGFRVIAPERPGFGLSSFYRYSIVDVADDVLALASTLDVGPITVVGMSGGGPYALATAWRGGPDRVVSAVALSCGGWGQPDDRPGMGRANQWRFRVGGVSPRLLQPAHRWYLWRGEHRATGTSLMREAPGGDHAIRADPTVAALLALDRAEGGRQGTFPYCYEMGLHAHPWGFPVEAISAPVRLYHGEADPNCPVAAVRRLAERIPDATLRTYPDEGHYAPMVHSDFWSDL